MSFTQLSTEVIQIIIENLVPRGGEYLCDECNYLHPESDAQKRDSQRDLSSLCRTCWRLHDICTPTLYRRERDNVGSNALLWAAYHDRVETLTCARSLGLDICRPDLNLMHYACLGGGEKTVNYLFSLGQIDANRAESHGWTPLELAAKSYSIPVVKSLLRNGAVNSPNLNGWPPITLAVATSQQLELIYEGTFWRYKNNSTGLRYLFPDISSLLQGKVKQEAGPQGRQGISPEAVAMGRLLAAQPLRVSSPQILFYLLQMAATARAYDIVAALLRTTTCTRGSAVDGDFLSSAVSVGDTRLVAVLMEFCAQNGQVCGNYTEALCQAAQIGHEDMVRLLLSRGAQVNGTSKAMEPRMPGLHDGHHYMATQLFSNRSDSVAREGDALSFAERYKHWSILSMLFDHGAVPCVQSWHHRRTIIHRTAPECSAPLFAKIVSLFTAGGLVDIDQPDARACSALHYAVQSVKSTNVEILLHYGADVNAKDMYGNTPLAVAVRNRRVKSVITLLSRADIHFEHVDEFGHSVFWDAHVSQDPKVFGILRDYASRHDISWPEQYKTVLEPSADRYRHRKRDDYCSICFRKLKRSATETVCNCAGGAAKICGECYQLNTVCWHGTREWLSPASDWSPDRGL